MAHAVTVSLARRSPRFGLVVTC